jgi:hypothetical protein
MSQIPGIIFFNGALSQRKIVHFQTLGKNVQKAFFLTSLLPEIFQEFAFFITTLVQGPIL